MVNLGRPSRGCKLCKARRIKCDEARPTCERCAKSGRMCPGYVDDWDLYMRDQTASVKNKVNGKEKSGALQVIAPGSNAPVLATWPFVYWPLSIAPESLATTYCFQSISAIAQTNESIMRYSDILPGMYLRAPANSALTHATDALALSLMWKAKRRDDMARIAHSHHLSAIQGLASIIADPATAYTDETLLTILLLTMFEVMAGCDKGDALRNHVNGAVMITIRRDHLGFHGEQSMMLFRAVRSLLLQNCTLASTSLRQLTGDFDWFASDVKTSRPSLQIFNNLSRMSAETAELRADAKVLFDPSSPCSEEQVLRLESRAETLLASLQEWHDSLPPTYLHETIVSFQDVQPVDYKIPSWNGIVHIYKSLWEANLVCTAATQLLYVAGVMLRCRCWSRYSTYTASDILLRKLEGFEVVQAAVDTICAAVPFCFGDHIVDHTDEDEIAGRGLSFITGPLRAAYITEGITEDQRSFVRRTLEAQAHRFGVDTPRLILSMPPSLIFQCTPFSAK